MPTLPAPSVAPRGMNPGYQTDKAYDGSRAIQGGFNSLAEGIGEGAQKFGTELERQEAKKQAEKQKADTVKVNNSLTDLDKAGTDELYGTSEPTPGQAADAAFDEVDASKGYLASKGLTAQELSTGSYDRIAKRAKEIGDSMDADQKLMWESASKKMLEQYYERIEGHAHQQRQQAAVDSLKNAEAEAQRKAALDPANDASARMSIGRIVGAQDQFVTSTEDALAKAEEVQGKVTAARLEALLAQPGGFTDAERILNENKGGIARLGRLDEYSKRIESAKLGGRAAVEASRIVDKAAGPDPAGGHNFTMPSGDVVEAELARIAVKDPALYEKVAPIARGQLALRAQAVKQAKEAFVDFASARYNKSHATFFASDLADRLNQVDPDKYRSLWNETYHRSKAASGDANALKAEKRADADAMAAYKAYGELGARASLNLDSWLAGKGLSDRGKDLIRREQLDDRTKQQKGLEVSETSFTGQVRARMQKFAPPAGNAKQRAAAKLWWDQVKSDAVNAYAQLVDQHPERKPTAEELRKAAAGVIVDHPPDPLNKEQMQSYTEAVVELAGGGKPKRTGRKKVADGVTYWETTDGGYETE